MTGREETNCWEDGELHG
jgi:hypothetical protein